MRVIPDLLEEQIMFDQSGDPAKARLLTIGYEGADIADIIATLKA